MGGGNKKAIIATYFKTLKAAKEHITNKSKRLARRLVILKVKNGFYVVEKEQLK
jgi:hypothetical protein